MASASNKRVAVLFYGESFRTGRQCSRTIGLDDEAYDAQKAASATHVGLLTHLGSAYDTCDVYISSVTTRFDADLVSFYGPRVKASVFVEPGLSYDGYHFARGNQAIVESGEIDNYDHVVYVRVDLHLKPHLVDVCLRDVAAVEKISFASICFLPHHKHHNRPRVNPVIAVIPKRFRHLIVGGKMHLNHDTWHALVTGCGLEDADLDVLLDTYHDSDSHKDWNPIYRMCSRPESSKWHSKGLALNKVTLEPEASTIEYDDLPPPQ